MITHLRGILTRKTPTRAVIDVGGVGYRLAISLHSYERLAAAGEKVELLTYTYVREDRLDLYGFFEEAEREMFELLIGVSGIGPKLAQTILSGMSVADLQRAIRGERVAELTQVRGVGTKTAQRLVVELRDKVHLPADDAGAQRGAPAEDRVAAEAALALEALGFAAVSARKAVATARKKANGTPGTVQDLIKAALRER